ncbi:Succinate-hydroxymethylglutarate CoA-transferase [Smittium culicis]|uniref:Succinate-hydroxymethylglutarate CoA-transferase n=1 Tax=Smittium culicis TaxID=133412 RepID=A0A1R1YMN9_9FUNG|nr:Succinate-hydroxymethylglutarate CoA-transferase [Smittium culicis]
MALSISRVNLSRSIQPIFVSCHTTTTSYFARNNISFNNYVEKSRKSLYSASVLGDVDIPKDKPLTGIRVLDMSRVLAGPYCTMMLGDLGAEVIKIEHPERGDDTRSWGPPFMDYIGDFTNVSNPNNKLKPMYRSEGESIYYLSVNRNKKSVTVNLKDKGGQQLIRELAAKSDIVVENYLPGKLSALGLGYEDLKKVNEKLVYASISGYGHSGPFSKKPGYDLMIEAEAGLMYITGEHTGPPVKVGVAITDITTGMTAHSAILAALYNRVRTNKGQHIDASLMATQLSTLVTIAYSYLNKGIEARRWGSEHATIVPYRNYNTKTEPITICCGNNGQFIALASSLGLESLISDERFLSNPLRIKNRKVLDDIIQARFLEISRDEALSLLNNKGVPLAPVNNMEQTFAHPQIEARGLVTEINHPGIGPFKLVSPAVQFSETPLTIDLPPPMLGQHTRSVLNDILGYSETKINQLCQDGSITTFDYGF